MPQGSPRVAAIGSSTAVARRLGAGRAGNLADGVVVGHAPAPASAPRRTRSGGGEAEGLVAVHRQPVAAGPSETTGRGSAMPQPFVVKISRHISTSSALTIVWQC